jgi:hypothetical protein
MNNLPNWSISSRLLRKSKRFIVLGRA